MRWNTVQVAIDGKEQRVQVMRTHNQMVEAPRDCPGRIHASVAFFHNLADTLSGDLPSHKFSYEGTTISFDRTGQPHWSACAPAGKYSLGEGASGQYAVDMNAYWRWSGGHCICIPARDLVALSDADFDMLAANTHPKWRTDSDLMREIGRFGSLTLYEERKGNYDRSIEIASNENLFEEFGIPLSGILDLDGRTLSQMLAAKEEEARRQSAEARCTHLLLVCRSGMQSHGQTVRSESC